VTSCPQLDTSKVFEKQDLVSLLYDHYRRQANGNVGNNVVIGNINSGGYGTARNVNTIQSNGPHIMDINQQSGGLARDPGNTVMNNESEQMVEILQEIIPYYGQGDTNIDVIVKDTFERLPFYSLENRDQNGNTLLMLTCQSGAIELVPLLLRKGSDPNAQNRFGETCLHFASYTDTYSPESAEVRVNFVTVRLQVGRAHISLTFHHCLS